MKLSATTESVIGDMMAAKELSIDVDPATPEAVVERLLAMLLRQVSAGDEVMMRAQHGARLDA